MRTKTILLFLLLGLFSPIFTIAEEKNMMQLTEETLSFSTQQLMELYKGMAKIPNRLPRTIDKNGKLVTSNNAWWTSGFFPGSLWYLYDFSGNEDVRKAALEITERIREQQFEANDHDIGFIIFCSFGNALRLTGNEEFESVVVNGAKSLSTRFRENIGVIKSWNNKKWQYPVIIDNMMNLEILTQATKISGDSSFYKIAVSHADTTIKYHFREDISTYHVVSYDTINGGAVERVTHQGEHDESAWARGQAWGLYGYSMMYRETGKKAYLEQAIKIADYIAGHKNLPEDKIPYWDFDAPNIPDALRDASAGAVMASALVELSTFTDKHLSEKYYELGKQMVRSLASPAYLAKKGENGHFILKHSVGHLRRNSEVDVPLTYADYYFIEAMMRIRKIETEKAYKINAEKLSAQHPRLFLPDAEISNIKKKLTQEPLLSKTHGKILEVCNSMIDLPLLTRVKKGRRILGTSREAIRRIVYLSYAYRMTDDKRYFERAHEEMLNLVGFTDWNPSHFLDVAEMTFAIAIGYDWLYNQLPETSKKLIAEGIFNKGLKPSTIKLYNGWSQKVNNWNQVCNGGMAAGAVALYNIYPNECRMILNRALTTLPHSMDEYANNGAYPEGYNYWAYGTTYNLFLLDLFTQNMGSDFNLSKQPGFMQTATFMQHMEGQFLRSKADSPAYPLSFNYADGSEYTSVHPAMFWFAAKNQDPGLIYTELRKLKTYLELEKSKLTQERFLPFLIIWGSQIDFQQVSPPTQRMFVSNGKTEVAMMRTSWTDDREIYVGIKGGTPAASHQHMDIGSFVMEAKGVRWALDFGSQDYNSLESKGINIWGRYQNAQRWNIFRFNNMAHNTLTINGNKQLVDGNATVKKVSDSKNNMSVSVNMTTLYKNDVKDLKRTISVLKGQFVQTEDVVITNEKTANIRWNMLTRATPEIINDNTILLTQNGEKLKVVFKGDVKVKASIQSTKSPNSYDAPNKGTAFIGFDLVVPANSTKKWQVKLIPVSK